MALAPEEGMRTSLALVLSGSLLWACGDVNGPDDDDDDDTADASTTIDGAGGGPDAAGGGPDGAGGDPDASGGDPDASRPPVFCAGFGGIECKKSEWCDFDVGCGFDDGSGVCELRPEACPDIFDPVCGCDFRTYGNECEANAEGQDVLHRGECKVDPGGGGGETPPS